MTDFTESNESKTEMILSTLKNVETSELFKILKVTVSEMERKWKENKPKEKKKGSLEKGTIPNQLIKPRAWVEYTLNDAKTNGWESFTINRKKKDKETKSVTEECVTMSESVEKNGVHVFKDSITDDCPNGRKMINKEAMSLSKYRKESGHKSYSEFEAQYEVEEVEEVVEPVVEPVKTTATPSVKPVKKVNKK